VRNTTAKTLAPQRPEVNGFPKAQCGADAAAGQPLHRSRSAAPKKRSQAEKPAATPAAARRQRRDIPDRVDPNTPRKARQGPHATCSHQYNATRHESNGAKWIEKGGGYYSECTRS